MRSLRDFLVSCAAVAVVAGSTGPALAADSPVEEALAKDKVCIRCHDETDNKPILAMYQTKHGVKADARTPGCQTCHGSSDDHVKNPGGVNPRPKPDRVFGTKGASPPEAQNEACMTCHQSGNRTHWTGSQHENRDLSCANCHSVHVANDPVLSKFTQSEVCFACHKVQQAQIHRFSTHPILVGKTACSDCHNPHGSTAPKLMVKDTVNQTCYTCHAEKRGPFLWEHSPVVDDCTTCHSPHGSNTPALLKARPPWLCQSCHSGDHGAAINSGANLPNGNVTTVNGIQGLANQSPRTQTNARACLNCHVLIHGSNHPAGAKFQR